MNKLQQLCKVILLTVDIGNASFIFIIKVNKTAFKLFE